MDTRKSFSIVVATIVVVSILATPVAAGMVASGSTDDGAQTFQDTETINLTDSIDVWENSPLPFRITNDPSFNIRNPDLTADYKHGGAGEVNIRKDEFAVYNKSDKVRLHLSNVSGANTTKYANTNAQLVVAHLESEESQTLSDVSKPANLGEVRDLLSPENANTNASFKVREPNPKKINDTGYISANFTAEKSGVYVAFLATGNEFDTDEEWGNLTLTGDPTTIVGIETVFVREEQADISPDKTAEPGDTVSFTVNQPSKANNHTVILYNEDQWNDSRFRLDIEEEFSTSMNESDFKLHHSINKVEGDISFTGPVTVMGTEFYDASFTGSVSTPALYDFVVETANNNTGGDDISEIPNESMNNPDTLYASATGISNPNEDTLTVNTSENWSEGEYRWVYLGSGSAETNFYTATDTITIKEASGGGGGGGGGGADAPPEDVEDIPASKNANIGGNNPVLRFDDGEFFSNVGFTSQTGLNALVSVTEVREPPAPGPTGSNFVAGADITFSSGDPGQVDTVQIGVQKTRLQSLGVSPNQLTVYHFDEENGEWEELETTVSYEDSFEVIVEAPSAGFSTYGVFAQQDDDVTTTEEPTPTTTEQPTTTEPGPTTTTTEAPPTTPPEEDGGIPMWVWGLIIVLLIGLGVAYYLWGWESAK